MPEPLPRRRYTKAFKLDVIAQSSHCSNIAQLAHDLGIRPELLYRWRSAYARDPAGSFPGHGIPQQSPEEAAVARLQRENATLRMERAILKKALGIFSTSDG
jgi:transposase